MRACSGAEAIGVAAQVFERLCSQPARRNLHRLGSPRGFERDDMNVIHSHPLDERVTIPFTLGTELRRPSIGRK